MLEQIEMLDRDQMEGNLGCIPDQSIVETRALSGDVRHRSIDRHIFEG